MDGLGLCDHNRLIDPGSASESSTDLSSEASGATVASPAHACLISQQVGQCPRARLPARRGLPRRCRAASQMSLDIAHPTDFTSGKVVRRPGGFRFQAFAPMVGRSYGMQQHAVEPTLLRATPVQGNNRYAVCGELHLNGQPITCDGLRSCATPHGRLSARFRGRSSDSAPKGACGCRCCLGDWRIAALKQSDARRRRRSFATFRRHHERTVSCRDYRSPFGSWPRV